MITPFTRDGRVDEEAAVAMGRHLIANGSDGLVVCGTTGEAATLSDDEHLGMIRLMVDELGDDAVIIGGVGSNDTRHAVHLTEAAAGHGCHALLSVTPYYNRPNARGIKAHFGEVAKAAGGVPVLVYNIPSRTGTNMGPELLAELAQIDGIDGVKQSNNEELQLIDAMAVFAGNDDVLAQALDLGGAGGICVSSHVIGNEMKALFDAEDRVPSRRRAARRVRGDVHHLEPGSGQGGTGHDGPPRRRSATAARGVRRGRDDGRP